MIVNYVNNRITAILGSTFPQHAQSPNHFVYALSRIILTVSDKRIFSSQIDGGPGNSPHEN